MSYYHKEGSPALTDASQVLAAALKEMDSIIASAEIDSSEHRKFNTSLYTRSLERPSKSPSRSPYSMGPAKPTLDSSLNNSSLKVNDELSELMNLRDENIEMKKELFQLNQTVALQRAEIEKLCQELNRRDAQLEAAEESLASESVLRKRTENDKLQLMSDVPALKLKLMRSEKDRMELTTRLKNLQSGFQRTLSNLTAADLSGVRSSTPNRSMGDKPPLPRPSLSPYANIIGASPLLTRKTDDRFQRFPAALYSTLPRNYKGPIKQDTKPKVELKALDARSTSAPELANPDRVIKPMNGNSTQPIISHTSGPKKIMKLFGKLSRSNSASNSSIGSFKRNSSTRATAMPRLCGWKTNEHLKRPLSQWDKKCISSFFQQLDLYDLFDSHLLTVHNGDSLLELLSSESFLSTIKHPLHKRKLQLAIQVFVNNDPLLKSALSLDTKWALSWLDDLGLPQYTDAFQEARVDGLLLHNMTLEDAGVLKISSQLHLLSIKWGVYVLRCSNFDASCLKRRSSGKAKDSPDQVALWTNHRVMEWLRDIDLAEFAPNLRGSGIHGALLVYEDSLGEGLLSDMLNIPPAKTLLRRHLTQQLKELVGYAIIQRKRGVEAALTVPLSPSTKVKYPKGTLGRRSKKKCDQTLVCPVDVHVLPTPADLMTSSVISMTSSTHSSISSNSTL